MNFQKYHQKLGINIIIISMREIVLDTETTGLKFSENHRIIEIAALEIIDFLPTGKKFHKYINPQRDVPESSVNIHGITEKFLEDKPLFKDIADEVGALTMTDASHFGGLVAGCAMKNPFDFGFDLMTTTTHKSLRGPRGGMVLCTKSLASKIDKSVFPGLQGGPHMNAVAAIALSLIHISEPTRPY